MDCFIKATVCTEFRTGVIKTFWGKIPRVVCTHTHCWYCSTCSVYSSTHSSMYTSSYSASLSGHVWLVSEVRILTCIHTMIHTKDNPIQMCPQGFSFLLLFVTFCTFWWYSYSVRILNCMKVLSF
jgi:hypothetical protein